MDLRSSAVLGKEKQCNNRLLAKIRRLIVSEEIAGLSEDQRLELCDRLDEAIGVSWVLNRSSSIETPDFRAGLSMRLASDLGLDPIETRQLDFALGEIVEQVIEGEQLLVTLVPHEETGHIQVLLRGETCTTPAAEKLRRRIGGGHAIP